MSKRKPFVYLAAPYSKGDIALNVRSQQDLFDFLLRFYADCIVPFAPLLTHYQHLVHPRTYEQWLSYDFDVIRNCDAVLRQPAYFYNDQLDIVYEQNDSPGADREIELATELGIKVFYEVRDLVDWARRFVLSSDQPQEVSNCSTGRCRPQ